MTKNNSQTDRNDNSSEEENILDSVDVAQVIEAGIWLLVRLFFRS